MNRPQDPPLAFADPLVGQLIAGNFRVEKLIGAGAMGNVYKCEQLSLGKAVAVKVLHPHLINDEKLVMRFKREAKSASLLNHPNSIQIIDSGQDSYGTLYIAMELLDGRDLAQVIRDDFPLPLPRIVRVMSQVLAALEEAHLQGVVHRDLKPSNIMLIERRGEKDFVKVCDFGIAKAQGMDAKEDRSTMLTIQGLVCGTPEYMAPEQARAEPLDGRADLYSAAVILYQLVTGDIPFRADSPMGIVSRHLSEPPVPPSVKRPDLPIPPVVDALILRGLEKQRELRFPSAVAFRDELESVASWLGGTTPMRGSALASAPTAQMTGVSRGETAVVAGLSGPQKFGSTANLSPRRPARWPLLLAGLAVLGAAGAAVVMLPRKFGTPRPLDAQALRASVPPPAAPTGTALPTPPAPGATSVAPAPAPPPPEPAPVAPEAPSVAAAPSPPALPAPASPPAAAREQRRKKTPAPAPAGAAPAAALAAPTAAPGAVVATAPSLPGAAGEDRTPGTRGPREVLGEGEKLLSQGEVKDACARGEEAKRMNPKLVLSYRFLGKCYMRAGHTDQARENYRKYLELAPDASDAMFIKSIVK